MDSYLDLSLNNVVYKGSADDVWETEVSELANPATISLTVDDEITEDVEIIHQKHDGTYEVLEAAYDAATKTITFETDSFSKYAIAQKKDHIHSYTKEIVSEDTKVADATCTTGGVYKKSCSCGAIGEETFTTDPLGHTMTAVKAKEANCKNAGNYAYWTCASEPGVYYKNPEGTETFANLAATVIPRNDSHDFAGQPYISDGAGHHYQTCKACGKHSELAACRGGKATCGTKATCEVCGEKYGNVDTSNHVIPDEKNSVSCFCGAIKNLNATIYDSKIHSETLQYTGTEVKPVITIDGLQEGVDFKVEQTAKVNPGVYTVTVTGIGSYAGTRTVEWKIISDDGWQMVGDEWMFVEDGLPKSGWVDDNGTWYYMDETGIMQTGWAKDDDTWYYMDESGAMQTGWILDGSDWYYLTGSGAMQTGWILDGNTWYYLTESGAMATGWLKDGDTWYYMDGSGAMQTGWVLDGRTWYYMDSSGAMQTGWVYVGGKWYYMYESGAMASNTYIDGYYVNASGAWVR
ncbi:MAG: hypothetical protein PUA62_10220 [Lachnospiraceae bacterium]|nr:hypothetical protein [Lachnospiraceae bacterium]